MTPSGNDGPRLSDADRDRIVQRLQHAFAEGRLSPGELDERLERALTAISGGDLVPVTAGLPDPVVDDVVRLRSTGGRIKRTGEWRVPRRLRIESEYGGVLLDLTQAVIGHPEIEIDLRLAYGSATIVLPPGATADADGVVTEWGGVKCGVPGHAHPGRPHVRVVGELAYGSVRVRHPRPWS